MAYFTVYYGSNESMMFNAECTIGSLVSHMIETLSPHTSDYTRLELVPLNFVLEHFKPPAGNSVVGTSTRSGQQQQQDAVNDTIHTVCNTSSAAPPTGAAAAKSTPFTGTIPLVGLATRSVESYADTLLGGATTGSQQTTLPQFAISHGNSTSASAVSGTNSSSSVVPTVPSPSLQNSYVLLGCRYHHRQQGRPNTFNTHGIVTGAPISPSTAAMVNSKNVTLGTQKISSSDAVTSAQQMALLRRAQLIAAAPIVMPLGGSRGGAPNSATGSRTTLPHTTHNTNTSVDPATLLMYNHGISLSDVSAAPWRKAFAQYLTTSFITPTIESTVNTNVGNTGMGSLSVKERSLTPSLDPLVSATSNKQENNAVLMPSAATGLFITPTPPIIGYDVLWRGSRGEHIRLQEALSDRDFTDTDTQKKKAKRA